MSIITDINDLSDEYYKLRSVGLRGYSQKREAHRIGLRLYDQGGDKLLNEVSLSVNEQAETFLNYAWDGIGTWVS